MIYNEGNAVPVPNLDLLSLIFDSPHCGSADDRVIHAEADHPEYAFTKAQSRVLTQQFAAFLRDEYGVGKSGPGKDVVVTVSTGQCVLPMLFYGVVAAEGVYSAASHTGTAKDLTRQILDGAAKLLVCSRDLTGVAAQAAEEAGLPRQNVLVLESYPQVRLTSLDSTAACEFDKKLDWRRITDQKELEQSRICILYSSGTTGLPKGVVMSHMNMVSGIFIPTYVNRPYWDEEARQGRPYIERRTLAHLPAAHIAGVAGYFLLPVMENGTTYWMRTFNFDDFLRHCGALKITAFFTVPPIWMAIAKHPAVRDQFLSLRTAVSGAAPLTADLQDAASKRLSPELSVSQVWGMSETSGLATHVPAGETVKPGSLGKLLPNVTMRLVDDNERDVKPGEPGEALIKGPIVTQGYHNNPKANADSFTADGWLRTGDILRMEDDEFYVVDRKKELIKYKGLQVAPAELEGIIASHPAVLDAAVIGVLRDGNEVPRAYVALAPPAKGKVSESDLIKYVESKVANHKRLRGGIKFIDAVPRSASGKILRKDLREMQKQEERQAKL